MKVLVKEKLSPHRVLDEHGYLICNDCIIARTGKQTYTRDDCFGDGDMTEIEVDRKPEEVFDPKALASFENAPITIEHPSQNVTPDNYNALSVGFVRDVHRGTYEGQDVVMATCVITDSEAIREVKSNELYNLSCGYDCDIEDCDKPCQKNIRGNHVALCEIPRAGITKIQDSKRHQRIIRILDTKSKKTKAFLPLKDSLHIALRNANIKYFLDNNEYVFFRKDINNARKVFNSIVGNDKYKSSGSSIFLKDAVADKLNGIRVAVSTQEKPTEVTDEDYDLVENCMKHAESIIIGSNAEIKGMNENETNYILYINFEEPINIDCENCNENEIDLCVQFWTYQVWLAKHDALMKDTLEHAKSELRKAREIQEDYE